MKKLLKIIISVAVVGVLAYVYRNQLQTFRTYFENLYQPCQKPITYHIESFDTRFGISKEYFLGALRDAEAIWEKPAGRELFANETEGILKINLIYDYRQEATATLQKLGLTVDDDMASYNSLKKKYDALTAAYALDEAAFEKKAAEYEARQSAYEKEVAYWNARHGAPPDEYDRLNAEQAALKAEANELSRLQAHLNEEIDTINALATTLNRLATTLNLQVSKFNAIGQSRGSEFEEGNYQSGPGYQQIDIYEFEDRGKLVRVIAHELGHALGLDHVDDQNAIMYRLNSGLNGKLTTTDLAALKELCGD